MADWIQNHNLIVGESAHLNFTELNQRTDMMNSFSWKLKLLTKLFISSNKWHPSTSLQSASAKLFILSTVFYLPLYNYCFFQPLFVLAELFSSWSCFSGVFQFFCLTKNVFWVDQFLWEDPQWHHLWRRLELLYPHPCFWNTLAAVTACNKVSLYYKVK